MVFINDGFFVKEIMGVSYFLLRYFMMQRSRYTLGYLFLISILLIFMNSSCMALYVLATL